MVFFFPIFFFPLTSSSNETGDPTHLVPVSWTFSQMCVFGHWKAKCKNERRSDAETIVMLTSFDVLSFDLHTKLANLSQMSQKNNNNKKHLLTMYTPFCTTACASVLLATCFHDNQPATTPTYKYSTVTCDTGVTSKTSGPPSEHRDLLDVLRPQ